MMKIDGLIHRLPAYVRAFLLTFIIVLSAGYMNGLFFLKDTSGFSVEGIERNYLGNEEDEEAEVMFFKKSEKEILTLIHDHMLSLSLLFLITGSLIAITSLPLWLKKLLMIEPLLSVLVTFEGIYFMWKGMLWLKYVIMLSGILMTVSYFAAVTLVVWQALKKTK